MSAETYTCENCGGTFDKGWSDEEARAEADRLWKPEDWRDGKAIVCDDCFKRFMAWMKSRN